MNVRHWPRRSQVEYPNTADPFVITAGPLDLLDTQLTSTSVILLPPSSPPTTPLFQPSYNTMISTCATYGSNISKSPNAPPSTRTGPTFWSAVVDEFLPIPPLGYFGLHQLPDVDRKYLQRLAAGKDITELYFLPQRIRLCERAVWDVARRSSFRRHSSVPEPLQYQAGSS